MKHHLSHLPTPREERDHRWSQRLTLPENPARVDLTARYRILLLDDLFEYGSTVGAVAKVLLTEGEAGAVYMLTLTRKRT